MILIPPQEVPWRLWLSVYVLNGGHITISVVFAAAPHMLVLAPRLSPPSLVDCVVAPSLPALAFRPEFPLMYINAAGGFLVHTSFFIPSDNVYRPVSHRRQDLRNEVCSKAAISYIPASISHRHQFIPNSFRESHFQSANPVRYALANLLPPSYPGL